MKFTFTDKKVNLPKSVHNYAEKKVGKLDRYFKTEAEAKLVFSVEKDRNKVELTIRSGSTILRVAESTSDMFASIDAAVTSMERQLRKHKTRLEKRLRQGAFAPQPEVVEEETSFVPEPEESEYQVVRTKKFPIKPMTVDEAILQMDLLGHNFFAFKDEDGGAFAVVYRRNDGGYGLIEDEG
ncbi:MAG: ribosome-associated translation inhibitor RaiA [Clostridiales bacterium]|nr:ribosome-associated translation inhibitor RaiA [Clostridiales bacterium]